MVVSGFEPTDIMQSIVMILRQLDEGRPAVENQHARVVRPRKRGGPDRAGTNHGAAAAFRMARSRLHFTQCAEAASEFADWDAEVFSVPGVRVSDPKACQCGEVLKGVIKPWECRVFGTACTPDRPIGTCMVSPEGACAAFHLRALLVDEKAGAEAPWRHDRAALTACLRKSIASTAPVPRAGCASRCATSALPSVTGAVGRRATGSSTG